jgi:hypothetical protein
MIIFTCNKGWIRMKTFYTHFTLWQRSKGRMDFHSPSTTFQLQMGGVCQNLSSWRYSFHYNFSIHFSLFSDRESCQIINSFLIIFRPGVCQILNSLIIIFRKSLQHALHSMPECRSGAWHLTRSSATNYKVLKSFCNENESGFRFNSFANLMPSLLGWMFLYIIIIWDGEAQFRRPSWCTRAWSYWIRLQVVIGITDEKRARNDPPRFISSLQWSCILQVDPQ